MRKGQKIKPGSFKGGKSQPAAKAPIGSGARFKALKERLGKEKGVSNPGGLAAVIGAAKYGKKKMSNMAAKGRKR